jgi:RHS repeat-associated protein
MLSDPKSSHSAGSTSPSDTFVYGAGGDLIKHGQNALPTAYFYPDALGSTSYVADASGNLIECYTYDLYGTPSFYDPNGVTRSGGSSYGISHLFSGQKWYPQPDQPELGLYDNRNRFYKPNIGRFLQPDPIGFAGDTANVYRYCANNPVNASDPFGLTYWYGLEGIGAPSRPGQFLKGLGAFAFGNVSIFIGAASSPTGIGTAFGVLAITSGVAEFGYGIENMVASYSDSPAAIAAAGDPKGIGEAAGRAIAGKQGQVYGGLIDSTIGVMIKGPGAASGEIPDLLEAGKSSLEFADSFYDAQEFQEQRYIMSLIPEHVITWNISSTAGTPFLTGDVWNFPLTIDASAHDSEGSRGFSSGLSLLGFVPVDSFRGADGFGGGGGLGPPGGLEKAVWDNMHKKKGK